MLTDSDLKNLSSTSDSVMDALKKCRDFYERKIAEGKDDYQSQIGKPPITIQAVKDAVNDDLTLSYIGKELVCKIIDQFSDKEVKVPSKDAIEYKKSLEKYIQKLPKLKQGDYIMLYGNITIFEKFTVQYNEAFEHYEIIIHTTGRGDPFLRTLSDIKFMKNNKLKPTNNG